MEMIVGIFIGIVIGVFSGWKMREVHAQITLNRMFETAEKEKITESIVSLELHREHDSIYVYDKKTNIFLVQVKSKEELFEFVNKKFANKNVIISKDDMALLDTL